MNTARIEQLKSFLSETPGDPFLNYALALEYVEEEPLMAKDIFDFLLENSPEYLPAYYHAAHLYWSLDLSELARETFEKGMKTATSKNDHHALRELKNAYQNFIFETDL